MANPRVRAHLKFYPEDSGKCVNEYWQAKHWNEELDPNKTTPMVVIDKQHFFINEPCLLKNGSVCMPIRWFHRGKKLFAKTWSMHSLSQELDSGWIVEEFNIIEVPQDQFLISFSSWSSSRSTEGMPSPSSIFGRVDELLSHHFQ